ncbi:MAG: VOC family protein [Rhizomicrobium sp.]
MLDNARDERSIFRASVIYQDDRAALDWLAKAFGFETALIITDDAGTLVHAEMQYRGALVMIARKFADALESPKALGGKSTQLLHVHVDTDIDAHFARARDAGAVILQEPSDQFYGDRTYRCADPEGHIWVFAQTVKVLTLGEMEQASGLTLRETL